MAVLLGLIHGADYLALHLAFGSLIFYIFIAREKIPKFVRLLFVLTLITSILRMMFSAQDMAESWAIADLWAVMGDTRFGHLWCVRILLLYGLIFNFKNTSPKAIGKLSLVLLAASLPLISSLSGHAASQESGVWWKVLVDWSHSIAVAVWTGGLLSLSSWLRCRLQKNQAKNGQSHVVVTRFSHFAMASTGIIGGTGILLAYTLGVSILHPWDTTYGLLLIGKVVLFSLALLAAAINQFVHLKNWNPADELSFVKSIYREVRLELILVTVIFVLAGFLTRSMLPS